MSSTSNSFERLDHSRSCKPNSGALTRYGSLALLACSLALASCADMTASSPEASGTAEAPGDSDASQTSDVRSSQAFLTLSGNGEAPVGVAQPMPVHVSMARPLDTPLEEWVARQQRDALPSSALNHPDLGLRNAGDPLDAFELLHMRTERTRYLQRADGSIQALTAQIPIFVERDGQMINAHPRLSVRGDAVEMDGVWLSGSLTARLSEGIRLTDPLGMGRDIVILDDASLVASGDGPDVELPFGGSDPAIDGTEVRYETGTGLTTIVDTVFDSIGYGFEIEENWVGTLPPGATTVEFRQTFALAADWSVWAGERQLTLDDGPIVTCETLHIDVPNAPPIVVRPPSVWDANDTFVENHGRATFAHGCGEGVSHRVELREDALLIDLVLDTQWLREPNRAFPAYVDPYWTFRLDMDGGSAPTPGVTAWTANGWLDDWANVNRPFAEAPGQVWTGRMGGAYYAYGRNHFSVEGIEAAAASPPGGENVDYFPTFISTNYQLGNWGWFPWRPASCVDPDPDFRWNVVEHVSYQDFRCTSGWSFACSWTTLRNGIFGFGRYLGSWTTRWTSGTPFGGWASPMRCNNCSGTVFEEAVECGEAGATMETGCRAFTPAPNRTITVNGNLSAGDVDHWGLVIPSGRSVRFTFDIRSADGTCSFDPVLELWYVNGFSGAVGQWDVRDDDFDPVTGVTDRCPTWTLFGFFPSGSYSIAVRGFSNLDVGDYAMDITFEDNPSGTTGFTANSIVGIGKTIDPSDDWLGPDATSDAYWSENLMPDLEGTTEFNLGTCAANRTMQIGSSVYRPDPTFVPYIEVRYVGRITNSPTNLAARPLSESECSSLGEGPGCGLEWTWDAAPKAVWYNLLGGVGVISNIFGLELREGGLDENTRYTRSIEGENDFAPGPVSPDVTRATAVRVPAATDVDIDQTSPTEFVTEVNAPVNMPASAYSCTGSDNCTAVRFQVRRCDPLDVACSSDGDCAPIAGQAATCYLGQCVADSGWTRELSVTWDVAGHACYDTRATYQNQDSVMAEGWSPWTERIMTTLNAPTLAAPTCEDMDINAVAFRWTDNSIGEEGFRLFPDATSTTSFVTEASTTSDSTGTEYSRTAPAVSAAGNRPVTAAARAFVTGASGGQLSEASNVVTAHTLHRPPFSNELQFDSVGQTAIDLTVVSAEASPCDGLTGARVQRCLPGGIDCVTLTTPPTSSAAGCEARGYGTSWEHDGGTIPGIGDGQIFDAGLSPNTTYEYRLAYTNIDGCIGPERAFEVTTLAGGPCCYDPSNPSNIASASCDGACSSGTIVCLGSTIGTCYCEPPDTYNPFDICDALDNDCDGEVDGQRRPLVPSLGRCASNEEVCVAGVWEDSPDNYTPAEETCEGTDEDCDGDVDEDPTGAPLAESCYGGPPGTAGRGICTEGLRTCSGGAFGACVGEVTPRVEACNGSDDDCDGRADSPLPPSTCLSGRDDCSGPATEETAGLCEHGCRVGTTVCDDGLTFCDIDAFGPVIDVQTEVDSVASAADFDGDLCDNLFEGEVCGASTSVTFTVTNEGQIPVPSDALATVYLDYGTDDEVEVAGPFRLGRDIPLDRSSTFTMCWQNAIEALAADGRVLNVVVYDGDEPETCIDDGHIGSLEPAQLSVPGLEFCNGIDDDCNGVDDRDQSEEACGNTMGDSTRACIEDTDGVWMCVGV